MQTKKQILNDIAYILDNIKHNLIDNKQDLYTAKRLKLIFAKLKDADNYIAGLSIIEKPIAADDSIAAYPLRGVDVANPDTCTLDLALLDKALAANADTDAVAKVIDAVVNTPRQDVQPKTDKEAAIKHSLAVEEALAKRYKALLQDTQSDTDEVVRLFAIDMITDAIYGKISAVEAADAIISLIDTANEQAADNAKLEHELGGSNRGAFEDGFKPISVSNADVNYIVNVDAAAKGKDKSDRRVFRKDANGRIVEFIGVNNDAPDELY